MKAKIAAAILLFAAAKVAVASVSEALTPANLTSAHLQSPVVKIHGWHPNCLWGPRGAYHRHVPGVGFVYCDRFHAAPPGGPYFYIVNKSTQMMAEVFAHDLNDGARVVLWPAYGGTSQQFTVEDQHMEQGVPGGFPLPDQAGWVVLRARHSGRCLVRSGTQTGAPVVQGRCDVDDWKRLWRLRRLVMTSADCPNPNQCFGGERLVLQNYYDEHHRSCLDAANGNFPTPPAQGAALIAFDCIPKYSAPNYVNQEWELVNIVDWGAPPVHHPGDP